jgi:cytochrome P450
MQSAAGPKAHPITGHLAQFREDRLGFFTHCARTYGDAVRLRFGYRRIILLSRPDLIEQVLVTHAKHFIKHFGLRMYQPILGNGLVTSERDLWRRQRKLSAPAFQPARLAGYAGDMIASAERMLDEWYSDGTPGGVRDVHDDLMRLTLDIACKTLFGADACPNPQDVGQAMEQGLRAIHVRFGRIVPIPEWFPAPSHIRLRRSLATIDAVVDKVIARRREPGAQTGNDLLSTLLQSRDETGSAMADAQLRDEVRTIFLAGHETTALALTYSLYLLAQNPACQEQLQAELSAVLGERPPAYEDLPRLEYTRKVVSEALRLYPPADVLGREAVAGCKIGDIDVKKGITIFMSPWVMHRDPRYFPNPETFDPSRWTEEFEGSLPRFAYFPFGGGPRFCIGQSFAMTEAILTLSAICRRYSFAPDPTFQLELWPSITLRPRDGVRLIVRDRTMKDSPRRRGEHGEDDGKDLHSRHLRA